MTAQETSQQIPTWVFTSLLSLLCGILIGLFVWIVNRILTQSDNDKQENRENFRRLTDAIVSIEKTTLVQSKILENHASDIKGHDEILNQLVGLTKQRK